MAKKQQTNTYKVVASSEVGTAWSKANSKNWQNMVIICLGIYILSRLLLWFEYASINSLIHNNKSLIDNLWRWDSAAYADIASRWYAPTMDEPNRDLWAWFPMWPMVIRVMSLNLFLPVHATQLCLNQVLLFGSMVLLWLYLRELKFERKDIVFGMIIVAVSPANIYFCSGLAEPLFLFLSLGVFYFLVTNRYGYLLAFACCLSATRMTGEFIIFPVLYHWYKTQQLSLKKALISIPIMSGGLIGYLAYMQLVAGDFLMFLHSEAVRSRQIMLPSEILDKTVAMLYQSQIYDSVIFLFSLFIITGVLLRYRLIKDAMFNLTSILPGYISGTLWNSFRFDAAIFPFYVGLIILGSKSDLIKYLLLVTLTIMSYICWFYWLVGSWYFA